jgi:hypothetical protein
MLTRKIWLLISFMFAFAANAESPWPSVQSNMYPYVSGMVLTRHEQTILLGEGDQQTGIFFSALRNTFSEQVQNELINDALLKSWSLHSLVRLGTRGSCKQQTRAQSYHRRYSNNAKGGCCSRVACDATCCCKSTANCRYSTSSN